MAAGWDNKIEALYRLDPDEFVAARNELAKQARGDDRKMATAIRNLDKPTVAAWGINQVALSKPKLVSGVVATTHDLQMAQEKALGGDRAALKAATDKRRKAVGAVVDAAIAALEAIGRAGESHREAIRNTIEAASLDAAASELLQAGRIEREMDAPAIFGGLAPIEPAAPAARRERGGRKTKAEPAEDSEELQRDARRARAEAEDLSELAATARERAQEAGQAMREAREAVDAAEAQLKEAKRGLDRAMDAARQTSLRASEIERRAEEAQAHAEQLEAAARA
jgi:hypothetical protein